MVGAFQEIFVMESPQLPVYFSLFPSLASDRLQENPAGDSDSMYRNFILSQALLKPNTGLHQSSK